MSTTEPVSTAVCCSASGGEACAGCVTAAKDCAACAAPGACADCAAGVACSLCSAADPEVVAVAATTPPAPVDIPDGEPVATIAARGMSCPLCASNADRRLMKIDGVTWTRIDLGQGLVTVGLDPAKPTPSADALQTAVRDAGFTAQEVTLPGEVRE
ncbi:MAG: heavy metal-associated domain-containing protein [Planctomycetota bacterium]